MKQTANLVDAIQPKPLTIATCRGKNGAENALVISYIANCCCEPPMLSMSLSPNRYSHKLIKETGAVVINVAEKSFAKEFEYLGTVSGSSENKLKDIKTTDADIVNAPILVDCAVNIECSVVDSIMTGSYETFILKVEKVHAASEMITEDGGLDYSKIDYIGK